MPAPPARMRSASVPCGTSSSSIFPARYCSVKARGSAERGNEQIIFFTMPASIIAAMPTAAVAGIVVDHRQIVRMPVCHERSISAWISSIGAPEPPKPPIMTVMPSWMPATAVREIADCLVHKEASRVPVVALADTGVSAPGLYSLCDKRYLLPYRTIESMAA